MQKKDFHSYFFSRKNLVSLLCIGVFSVGTSIFVLIFFRLWNFTVDDTFIGLRYAFNLTHGFGLVYNPGERVEAYTDFLWIIFFSFPFLAHLNPVLFIKMVNIALVLGSAVLIVLLGRSVYFKKSLFFPALSAALFLASPYIGISASEGLETIAFIFLLLLSVLLFTKEYDSKFPWSAAVLFLLFLTRPDGALFIPLFLVLALLLKRSKEYIFGFLLLTCSPIAIYLTAHFYYYHFIFPNSFYAKQGGTQALIKKGFGEAVLFFRQAGLWMLPFLIITPLRKNFYPTILLVGVIVIRVFFAIISGGEWIGHFRFLVPTLPFFYILFVAGLSTSIRNRVFLTVILLICTFIIFFPSAKRYLSWEKTFLDYSKGLNAAHIALGKDLFRFTPQSTIVACTDAGAIAFYSQRINIDASGLTDAYIGHLPGFYNEKTDVKYVLSRNPQYIVLLSLSKKPTGSHDFSYPIQEKIYASGDFQKKYTYDKYYEFSPNYYLVVYKQIGLGKEFVL